MTSEIDGYMFCLNIRKESSIPIILVTTFSAVIDRLINFKIGVDDYVTKPFYLSELEAKVKFLLWRTNTPEVTNVMLDMTMDIADFQINIIKQQVLKGQQTINLTKIEFTLLELLVTKAGETLSRNFILNIIWGYTPKRYADTKLVDVHISRLRSKIEKDPRNPTLIVTDWGKGYKFNKFQS
jgi:OmpR family response regulator RpaB